jgi:hypothetical protein
MGTCAHGVSACVRAAQELDAEAAQRRSELEQTKQRIASLETQARY